METLLHSIIETTKYPPQMHAVWVHFPVAASFLGLVLLVVLLLTGSRWGGMRWACVLVYAMGAGAGFMAFRTGGLAADEVSTTVNDAAQKLLQTHAEMGEKVWIFLLATALLTAFTAVRITSVRSIMSVLALLVALASAAWVGVTAHYGGSMVYQYGVGTKPMTLPMSPAKPGSAATMQATMAPATTQPVGVNPAPQPVSKTAATAPTTRP